MPHWSQPCVKSWDSLSYGHIYHAFSKTALHGVLKPEVSLLMWAINPHGTELSQTLKWMQRYAPGFRTAIMSWARWWNALILYNKLSTSVFLPVVPAASACQRWAQASISTKNEKKRRNFLKVMNVSWSGVFLTGWASALEMLLSFSFTGLSLPLSHLCVSTSVLLCSLLWHLGYVWITSGLLFLIAFP